jgi:hypothetical protein
MNKCSDYEVLSMSDNLEMNFANVEPDMRTALSWYPAMKNQFAPLGVSGHLER